MTQYASLVDLKDIQARMSDEQRDDFLVADLMLTIIFIVCVFGVLVFSAVLLTIKAAVEVRRL